LALGALLISKTIDQIRPMANPKTNPIIPCQREIFTRSRKWNIDLPLIISTMIFHSPRKIPVSRALRGVMINGENQVLFIIFTIIALFLAKISIQIKKNPWLDR